MSIRCNSNFQWLGQDWHCSMHCIATYHLYLWHAIVMVTRVNRCARSAAISHDDDDDDDDDVDDDDMDDDD